MAIIHPTDRDAFGHWLAGFVDGEGMFILTRNAAQGRLVSIPSGRFEIHLRADDRAILKAIHSFLGVGKFYTRLDRIHGKDKGQTTSRPQVALCVRRAAHLEQVIVDQFTRFPLRAKKANDFAIWRHGVALLYRVASRRTQKKLHGYGTMPRWTTDELSEFDSLVSALKEQRKFENSGETLSPVPKSIKLKGWFD